MDQSISLWRRASAEALAAFALVFAGCGAAVTDARYHGALGAVGISLVFGLVIMAMIYATGHLSGAHINPAVTVAFTLARHFSARDAIAYVAAQCAGGDGRCGRMRLPSRPRRTPNHRAGPGDGWPLASSGARSCGRRTYRAMTPPVVA